MNGWNGHDTEALNAPRAARTEETLGYHVLMNSRRYGTSSIACTNMTEAARTLAWLAERAEVQRHVDGAQRYFCLLPPEGETSQESVENGGEPALDPVFEDAIVVCVGEDTLQWIAGEGLGERPLLILEALGSPAEGPFLCWEACARSFATLDRLSRHTIRRFLYLRSLREQNERNERKEHTGQNKTAEEDGPVDPVVDAWQRTHSEEAPPLTLAPVKREETGTITLEPIPTTAQEA